MTITKVVVEAEAVEAAAEVVEVAVRVPRKAGAVVPTEQRRKVPPADPGQLEAPSCALIETVERWSRST